MENTPVSIAVCNQKGGVGKSTFTVLLASHLHYTLQRDVLVVDCDALFIPIKADKVVLEKFALLCP